MATAIRNVMTSRVVTVRSGESVRAAAERMTRYGFSALPVVTASGRLVGIVSLLDVLRYRQEAAEHGLVVDDDRVAVDEIMTTDVLAMAPTANVAAVADRLRRYGELRVLPIVDGKRLVGVVTRGDLLRRLLPGAPTRRHRLFGRPRIADAEIDAVVLLAAQRRLRQPAAADAPVRDVMTAEVVTVGPSDLVTAAALLMLRGRHSGLPVVDGERRLLGVVTEADLLTSPTVPRPGVLTVGQVMNAPAVAVAVDTTVVQARAVLVEHELRTLPVVTGAGADAQLVGVLGRSDLV